VKLEQEQQFLIAKKLQELTGSKNIKLKPIIDQSLIAGFVVEYGSSQIDLSIRWVARTAGVCVGCGFPWGVTGRFVEGGGRVAFSWIGCRFCPSDGCHVLFGGQAGPNSGAGVSIQGVQRPVHQVGGSDCKGCVLHSDCKPGVCRGVGCKQGVARGLA
jgi:hypothetical protein